MEITSEKYWRGRYRYLEHKHKELEKENEHLSMSRRAWELSNPQTITNGDFCAWVRELEVCGIWLTKCTVDLGSRGHKEVVIHLNRIIPKRYDTSGTCMGVGSSLLDALTKARYTLDQWDARLVVKRRERKGRMNLKPNKPKSDAIFAELMKGLEG